MLHHLSRTLHCSLHISADSFNSSFVVELFVTYHHRQLDLYYCDSRSYQVHDRLSRKPLNIFDLAFHPRGLWSMVPVAVTAGIWICIVRVRIVLTFWIND